MTRVKKDDGVKGKVADLKEIKICTGSESVNGVAADGPEEYSKKMLIRVVRQSADGSVADKSEKKESLDFVGILMIRL